MANQKITQLPIAVSASSSDLVYIVDNYIPGDPAFVGDSRKIYFSSISQSITSVGITNNVNNAVVTSTGTSPGLTGESNLTFDGTNLNLTGNTTVTGKGTFGSLQITTGATITATTTSTLINVRKTNTQNILSGNTPTTLNGFTSFLNQQNWGEFSTTGLFTATKSAVYRFAANIGFTNATGLTGSEYALIMDKNGAEIVRGINYTYSSAATFKPLRIYGIVDVRPGDILSFRASQNGTSTTSFLLNSGYIQFTIEELPNILTK
jgi:hypothetical protein